MASLPTIPRFLLPRGPLLLRARAPATPLHTRLAFSAFRYASSARPKSLAEQFQQNKPRVIPQPDKYRPPSHGRRTPRSETAYKTYGPKLSEEDRKRMETKKYPNMMSPKGTFSHWFIHNRSIHVYIVLGILISLCGAAWWMDFAQKTLYWELLPSRQDFYRHPIESWNRWVEVYKMHLDATSREGQALRMRRWEDYEKRKQFRLDRVREVEARGEEYVDPDPRYYVDSQGVRRRRVKRWFGIWE